MPPQDAESHTNEPQPQPQQFAPPPEVQASPPQGGVVGSFGPPPAEHSPSIQVSPLTTDDPVRPVPVVHVLSPRGVEYVLLTICLFIAAGSLMGVLVSLIYGSMGIEALAFPVASLLVTVPIFALLFLRLKQAELLNPELKLDQSKRRSTQFTLVVSFLVSIFALIGMIYSAFSALGGEDEGSLVKSLGSSFVVLIVSAGVFAYYWFDEHRK